MTDLRRDDFRLFENGREVEITAFSNDPQPLSVAVMLDASATGGPSSRANLDQHASELRRSVLAFMGALGADDRASLGTFGAEIAVGGNWTNDLEEFERVLREEYWTGMGAGTPLWQAVSEAASSLAGQPGRPVVLLFTDGHDTGSFPGWRGSPSTVERQLLQQDAMVYLVRPAWWGEEGRLRPLPAATTALAEKTGGGYFEVPRGADLPSAFSRVAAELRHQYLLGFTPAAIDGKSHSIDVRVAREGVRVRARTRHWAGPRMPSPAAEHKATPPEKLSAQSDVGRHPQAAGGLLLVVLLDATWTVAHIMAPFVWDGSRSEFSGPIFTSGRRLPHRPEDLFGVGLRDGLLPSLQPGDRVRLGTISRQLRLSDWFPGDSTAFRAAARQVLSVPDDDRYGPSPIWDGVDDALTILEREPGDRAIVLVTDGMPTGNKVGLSSIRRRAADLGIPIFVLHQVQALQGRGFHWEDLTGNPWMLLSNPLGDSAAAMLRSLADSSGGAYFDERSTGRIASDAEGKFYPEPASGRPRGLVGQFQRIMREALKGRAVNGRRDDERFVR
jgi:Ca-activated chloride channel homolog